MTDHTRDHWGPEECDPQPRAVEPPDEDFAELFADDPVFTADFARDESGAIADE
jgi:hypothetical protein